MQKSGTKNVEQDSGLQLHVILNPDASLLTLFCGVFLGEGSSLSIEQAWLSYMSHFLFPVMWFPIKYNNTQGNRDGMPPMSRGEAGLQYLLAGSPGSVCACCRSQMA